MSVIRDLLELIGRIKIPKFPNTGCPARSWRRRSHLPPAPPLASTPPAPVLVLGAPAASPSTSTAPSTPKEPPARSGACLDRHDRRQGRTI